LSYLVIWDYNIYAMELAPAINPLTQLQKYEKRLKNERK